MPKGSVLHTLSNANRLHLPKTAATTANANESHLKVAILVMTTVFQKARYSLLVCLIAAPATAQLTAGMPSLPPSLSIGGMFQQADWVVKFVILGLLAASLVTWSILIAKTAEFRKARAASGAAFETVKALSTFDEATADPRASSPLVAEAAEELALSQGALSDPEGIKERIVSRFERHEAGMARRWARGVNVLATIGATAPFVGLFGTVWGIMNSFIGIAEKQTTNLAVVAPGIAEALLATALGLVAAIPAVVIYNHFARQIVALRAVTADTAAAVLRLVSRDLSSRGVAASPKAN